MEKIKNKKYFNLNNVLIITIFIFALFVRIYYFDSNLELFSDENVYHYAGANIVEHGVLTSDRDGAINRGESAVVPSSAIQPGYPFFIGLIYKVFGENQQIVRMANIIISMLSMLLIYKISKLVGLRKPYIIIVLLLVTLYPGFNYNTAKMLSEHLFTLLLLGHIYYFIRYLKDKKTKDLLLFTTFISLSIFVRAHGFPILIMSILFMLIYHKANIKELFKKLVLVMLTFVVIQLPWWIRNYILLEKFVLFSEAGDNPKVWGALPYFIGIFEVGNQTLNELLSTSINVNEFLFYKWRIFGFFQYMWADIWDEYLVHPFQGLRPFMIIQLVIVVPTLILLPVVIMKCKKEILYLTTIPIIFTIMNLPYHGLPRYVWPSISIVIILFGYMLQFLIEKKNMSPINIMDYKLIERLFRRSYLIFSLLFSLIMTYSVYYFSFNIEEEMSEFRLQKYAEISIAEIEKKEEVILQKYNLDSENLTIENAESIESNKFKNIVSDPTLIRLGGILTTKNDSVTKVEIKSKGGYIYDYMTVYWKTNNDSDFSESKVYRFPTNLFESKQTIFVEGDVSDLMIVPVNFRGGSFIFDEIIITKYINPNE
ncbi:ArnT family glycosyltransferase [Solibacillus cecembensis]|uniref:ArnT family glycosyltransferase n=1 Tax=Solibacillus cecembensis TaxID=459347 RepID=UPI003CFCE8F4